MKNNKNIKKIDYKIEDTSLIRILDFIHHYTNTEIKVCKNRFGWDDFPESIEFIGIEDLVKVQDKILELIKDIYKNSNKEGDYNYMGYYTKYVFPDFKLIEKGNKIQNIQIFNSGGNRGNVWFDFKNEKMYIRYW